MSLSTTYSSALIRAGETVADLPEILSQVRAVFKNGCAEFIPVSGVDSEYFAVFWKYHFSDRPEAHTSSEDRWMWSLRFGKVDRTISFEKALKSLPGQAINKADLKSVIAAVVFDKTHTINLLSK